MTVSDRTRALVADNSPLILEYMEQVLTEAGCEVLTVPDGLQALKVIDTFKPNVLFTDIIMPYVDGLRLTRVLRSRPRYESLFIVAFSAIARESDLDLNSFQIDLCIAKGPLREMSTHVIAAIDASRKGRVQLTSTPVIGLESVHERQITRELLSELGRHTVLANSLQDGVLTSSVDGLVVAANRSAERILGVPEEELLGTRLDLLQFDEVEDGPELLATLFPKVQDGNLRLSGESVVLMSELPISDSVQELRLIVLRDVTELVHSHRRLQNALEDRELLLREVHHRVKNNLSTISSLISLQSGALPEGDARLALEHLRAQVESIGLVHDRIYNAETVSTIQFKQYVSDLLANLIRLHDADERIRVQITADPLELQLGTAIPLGLSLSELIINSLKHGFGDGRSGTISVRLRQLEGTHWMVEYEDDGIGLPPGLSSSEKKTLGIRLLSGLASQMGGSITFPDPPDRLILLRFNTEVM